ncbi:MAG: UDP-N-acetylmuramate dehydrogenase [Bacteroidetes bacterium]|nr:UDP-N-acetylmuramate dehydrogenase [Bacteroidota bacterium]
MLKVFKNHSLHKHNTFRVKVSAKFYAAPETPDELITILHKYRTPEQDMLIIGEGSNILLTNNFQGLVIRPDIKGIEILDKSPDNAIIKVWAGENWDNFVVYCINNGFGGVENLSWIPGSVGACPIQNIGAYGAEVENVIESVTGILTDSLEQITFTRDKCNFGYRDSIFKQGLKDRFIITNVIFTLSRNPVLNTTYGRLQNELAGNKKTDLQSVRQAVIKIRKDKLPDPDKFGSAGSFFRNPVISKSKFNNLRSDYSDIPAYPANNQGVKIAAGWLIEKAGWAGKRTGDAGVYNKQALILLNYGSATGKQIKDLAEKIMISVSNKFGIDLQTEVNII